MLGAVENDKFYLVSTTSSIYKNSNHTHFTTSAVHNESNFASQKEGSGNWDANETIAIV